MRTGGERIRYRKRGDRQKRGKQNTNKEEKDTDKQEKMGKSICKEKEEKMQRKWNK